MDLLASWIGRRGKRGGGGGCGVWKVLSGGLVGCSSSMYYVVST